MEQRELFEGRSCPGEGLDGCRLSSARLNQEPLRRELGGANRSFHQGHRRHPGSRRHYCRACERHLARLHTTEPEAVVAVPELTRGPDIKLNLRVRLLPVSSPIDLLAPEIALFGSTPVKSSRQDIRRGVFYYRREASLRRLVLIAFSACFWLVLLAAIVTTVARLGTEAKEHRSQAASLVKTRR